MGSDPDICLCPRRKATIEMSQMSPLARLLISILRWGSMGSAGLLLVFAGILTWQRWTPGGPQFTRADWVFLGILAALLALALYLVRAIAKEISDHSGPSNSGT